MTAEPLSTSTRPSVRRAPVTGRFAGAGGLFFVAALITQNILRASGPSFTADPATVTSYFADHPVAGLLPLAMFPLEMLALFCFVAGLATRAIKEPAAQWWAALGVLAVVAIAGLFALVNITEIVIAARGGELIGSPQVVRAVWAIHSAAFGLNLGAIAIALLGLSRAARALRLIPRALAIAALPGASCLLVAAVFTVSIVVGGSWLYLGLIGFAVWGVFVVVTAATMLAGRQVSAS